jgi:hypothetical protein
MLVRIRLGWIGLGVSRLVICVLDFAYILMAWKMTGMVFLLWN